MSCGPLDGLPLGGGAELTCQGAGAVAQAGLWLGLAVAAVAAAWVVVQGLRVAVGARPRPSPRTVAGGLLLVLAAVSLGIAMRQPEASWTAERSGGHLVVVIDVSDSVTRAPAALREAGGQAAAAIRAGAARPGAAAEAWTASVIAFARDAARVHAGLRLTRLPGLIDEFRVPSMRADESDGAAALALAAESIEDSGVPGAVLLLSDGNWRGGDLDAVVRRLVRGGIPVHVMPVSAPRPSVGIVAADLPSSVEAGAATTVRTVLMRGADDARALRIGWRATGTRNGVGEQRLRMTHSWHPAPIRVSFDDRGMQFLDLSLTADEGGTSQRRRLFTTVLAPPRVLLLGEARWAQGLAADAYRIERRPASEPFDVSAYDVVVVDGVRADALADGMPAALARAVRTESLGLLIVNGPNRGHAEAPTVFMSYEQTPLEPVLPVSSDARLVIDEPPPRDVIIVIDTSASMAGWNLQSAKAIGADIVDSLRPADSARIVAFSDSYTSVLGRTRMDGGGRSAARRALSRLTAGGGTDPTGALTYAARFENHHCGLFFLSDGEFNAALHERGCMTTVFRVDERGGRANPELARLGQVVNVDRRTGRQRIELEFFEPDPRRETWRPGRFVARHVGDDPALAPPLALDGVAISYRRPESQEIAVHPDYPPDPVLAFREAETGTVGAFMSELPAAWGRDPAGRAAIEGYIDRLAGWHDLDRFAFAFRQIGDDLEVTVTVVGDGSRAVNVERLNADIAYADGGTEPLPLRPVAATAGVFRGRLPLPPPGDTGSDVARATLRIAEHGAGATVSEQRIPMSVPVAGERTVPRDASESWDHGVNEALLRRLAEVTDGRYPLADALVLDGHEPPPVTRPLFAWFLAAAAACVVAGVALGGGRL